MNTVPQVEVVQPAWLGVQNCQFDEGAKIKLRPLGIELRASGEKKYYLANLPAATDLRTLATTIKARWICEQAHQQLKEELGLDHFEGRSWQGLHRHALMTASSRAALDSARPIGDLISPKSRRL